MLVSKSCSLALWEGIFLLDSSTFSSVATDQQGKFFQCKEISDDVVGLSKVVGAQTAKITIYFMVYASYSTGLFF